MKESHTAYLPRAEHIPQSAELAIEGIRRQVEAQKLRDISEQEKADELRLKILRDSRPH